jgi:uncharacterized protein (TIGR02453 family)
MNTMSIITLETFQFLKKLGSNNNKPWFEKNRDVYENARANYIAFVTKLLDGIRKVEQIPEREPVKYVQRIYRDIRFSKDKTPYKTYFSSLIERGPEIKVCPVFIRVKPGGSMMGGGVWDPTPEALKMIRQEIDYNAADLRKIINKKEFVLLFEKISGERLARMPKGYEADNPNIELLKYKQFFVQRPFPDDLVLSKDFIPELLKSYRAALPFFRYFDAAMGE